MHLSGLKFAELQFCPGRPHQLLAACNWTIFSTAAALYTTESMISCLRYLPYRTAIAITRQEVVWTGCERQRRITGRAKVGVPQALKGTGDPTIMRRLVDIMDAEDDVDDDFLAEDAKGSASSTPEPSQRKVVQPDPDNPRHVKIRTSHYVGSATKLESCPQDGRPEFAIIGRSNVGKSSLINMMTKNKNLALTSKQPGIPLPAPARVRAKLDSLVPVACRQCRVQARPSASTTSS